MRGTDLPRFPKGRQFEMSYGHALLFQAISQRITDAPLTSLRDLSLELRVSRRTLQQVVRTQAGKSLRELRKELLIARVVYLLASQPGFAIKEVSFAIGFRSPRSFARSVKRICGFSPGQLRCLVGFFRVQEDASSSANTHSSVLPEVVEAANTH